MENLPEETSKPTSLWKNTLQTFKGKGKTEELIEEFTSEVALVVEGLWHDQEQLGKQINQILMEQTLQERKYQEMQQKLQEKIQTNEKEMDLLKKQLEEEKKKKKKEKSLISQISLLVFIVAGAWVLVTIIKAFFS